MLARWASPVTMQMRAFCNGAPVLDDRTWCAAFINLARRADRRTNLASTLSKGNSKLLSKLSRIDATDGREIDLDDAMLHRYVSEAALVKARNAQHAGALTLVHQRGELVKWHDHLTSGAIACAISHHAALQFVAHHPTASWGLILEDDITGVVPNVHERIAHVLRAVPPDCEALFLGYHGGVLTGTPADGKEVANEEMRARIELQVDSMRSVGGSFVGAVEPEGGSMGSVGSGLPRSVPLLRMYMPIYGLYAWMVRRGVALQLIDQCFPIQGQVDRAMSQWLQQRGRSFRAAPKHMLFFSPKSEVGLDSDVQTMMELQHLVEDEELCQRYAAFVKENPSAEERSSS